MKIVKSRISVYEIELNLEDWKHRHSREIPHFFDALKETMPSLESHPCMQGKTGGFFKEIQKGTNFAHVVEHILLELLHLADAEGRIYKGWTRRINKQSYLIHYDAPDFLTAALVAILAVDLVKRLTQDESIKLDEYIHKLKSPAQYFTDDHVVPNVIGGTSQMELAIKHVKTNSIDAEPVLTSECRKRIQKMIVDLNNRLFEIGEQWEQEFVDYAGQFGTTILPKLDSLNIHHFLSILKTGDFNTYFRGVKNLSIIISVCHIPIHFAHHSLWLYKNILLKIIIKMNKADEKSLHQAISDLEDFFRIIFFRVNEGYALEKSVVSPDTGTLRDFRELGSKKANVLVVDDDEMLLKTCVDILKHHGFQTLSAKDGIEALDVFTQNIDSISMVILDNQMPGLGGVEVCRKIQRLQPDVKVLLTSGFALDEKDLAILESPNTDLIAKPFQVEQLIFTVNCLLGEIIGIEEE